ncbi:PQQ-binding-like beta-propeller repeat protein [Planctomicrobium sp. SH661]|uniref:outer membrane protein assembly factor BamB family protein n=1 Tax=Planctomicrobium sp. SH661 TaxID=3448124 RepID=UPI003F5C6CC6
MPSHQFRLSYVITLPSALRVALIAVLICSGLQASAQEQGKRKNQLGELFRQLDRGIREGGEDLKNQKTARDQFDIRPIQRAEDNRRLQQANELIAKQRWHDAVEVLQFLLDLPSDGFSIDDARDFHSLQTQVDDLIAGLPPEGQRSYASRYSTVAQQLFDAAVAEQDDLLLVKVSTHYFHTSPGRAALQLLARRWEDQAEFGQAASAWLRLLPGASETDSAEMRLAAARNLARAGRTTEARELVSTFPNAEEIQKELDRIIIPASSTGRSAGAMVQLGGAETSPEDPTPSPLPVWSESLIERYGVRTQIDRLSAELQEQGRALLPTLFSLSVDGKLALRTLRSLQVRDLSTGEILWEHRMNQSPEELLTLSSETDGYEAEIYRYSDDSTVEHQALTSLLYRDEVYGNLSSDGRRLYAVESSGKASLSSPMHMWQMQMDEGGRSAPWETNELTAYDLQTGWIRWKVGGTKIEDEFSRPLAGTRFFSAPIPDGNELFVIGERQGEVSLFCLSARTGEELWSQPLAAPGRPIKEDLVRTHYACQPVLADGTILCPTTCGWLIAVDRATHRLKWTCRFAPRMEHHQQFRGGYSGQPLQELNRRWQAVMTLVAGDKVLVTPPEVPDEFGMSQPMLYCIDLQTGKILWEQTKAERSGGVGLYLAGVWNGQAIVVGTTSVIGRSLENRGDVLWTVALPQRPTGRGIIVNDSFLLPVAKSRLLKINLKSAGVEKTVMVAVEHDLGNLNLHQGHLIVTSYDSALVFSSSNPEPKLEANPELLANTKLREAKFLLTSSKFDEVQARLREALAAGGVPPDLKKEIKETQREALRQQLKTRPANARQLLSELNALAESPEQKRESARMEADFLRESEDFAGAVQAYLDILDQSPLDERVIDETREVRIDSWIGGRLQQLYEAHADEAQRQEFQRLVQLKITSLGTDPVVKDRWARALAFDVSGLLLELDLADLDLQNDSIASGMLRLIRVTDAENQALRPQALVRLGNELNRLGWHQDALETWQRLEKLPAVPLQEGTTSAEVAASGIEASRKGLAAQSEGAGRWEGPWTLERIGISRNERDTNTIPMTGSGMRALSGLRLEQEHEAVRIRVEDRRTGTFLASLPLRSDPALEHNPSVGSRLLNSMILVMHRGVLHALAWPDQKMLWTWNSDLHGLALTRISLVHPNLNFTMQPIHQFNATRQFHANRNQTGYLLAASPRALLLHCKDWIALDPLSGEELWREHATSDRGMAQELGTEWFITSTRSGRSIRSVINGQPRKVREKQDLVSRTVTTLDQDLICLSRNAKRSGDTAVYELQRITPTGDVTWTVDILQDSLLGLPDAQSLLVLSSRTNLAYIDLRSGTKVEMGKIPAPGQENQLNVSVISDEQRFYLFIDSGDSQPLYVNIPAIRFAGKILTFDRKGNTLWTYDTPYITPTAGEGEPIVQQKIVQALQTKRRWPLHVPVQDFSDSPLLLLVGDRQEHKSEFYYHQIRVLGLDKATGQQLIDWERPSESGGFSYLHIDPEQQSIEIRTHNERLQLRPQQTVNTDPEPAEPESAQ